MCLNNSLILRFIIIMLNSLGLAFYKFLKILMTQLKIYITTVF